MISEGSCDNEDWSNDAENSALLHRNKLYFKLYKTGNQILEIAKNISQYYCIISVFWSNKYSLDEAEDSPLKTRSIYLLGLWYRHNII